MTQDMMTLRALLEKSSDADLLREMIGFTAERLMALEVEGLTGAGHGERSADRITHRNGYRDRSWETRAGAGVAERTRYCLQLILSEDRHLCSLPCRDIQAAVALFRRSRIRSLRVVSCFRWGPVTSSLATKRLSCAPGIAIEYRCRIGSGGSPP